MVLDTTTCVVLNATYEPINVVTSARALILFLNGKAIIVEEHPELVVRSSSQTFPVPVMIALKKYIMGRRIFQNPALLTQKNLFTRDSYTCQYCGRHRSKLSKTEFLTRDHVHPQAKGGENTWTNVVTCCSTCNNKKSDKTLREIGFVLLKQPTVPTIFEIWRRQRNKLYSVAS